MATPRTGPQLTQLLPAAVGQEWMVGGRLHLPPGGDAEPEDLSRPLEKTWVSVPADEPQPSSTDHTGMSARPRAKQLIHPRLSPPCRHEESAWRPVRQPDSRRSDISGFLSGRCSGPTVELGQGHYGNFELLGEQLQRPGRTPTPPAAGSPPGARRRTSAAGSR